MSKLLAPILGLVLLLVLASCAPGAAGSGPGSPFQLPSNDPAQVSPGRSLYLRQTFPASAFNFTEADLQWRWVPLGTRGLTANLTSEFQVVDMVMPEGWSWRLDNARVDSRDGTSPTYTVTLRVDVPAGARLGGQRISATVVTPRTGRRQNVAVVVQVVGP